ncbi:MAG: hypothetical protein IPI73_21695 [Betaproteobacteria bacterium]|nr:hypothetical protein [Betaproteobacteria bacterium]
MNDSVRTEGDRIAIAVGNCFDTLTAINVDLRTLKGGVTEKLRVIGVERDVVDQPVFQPAVEKLRLVLPSTCSCPTFRAAQKSDDVGGVERTEIRCW